MLLRQVALGLSRWALLFYVLIIGYFMYMVYRISASLQRVAATLEQLRLERAAARNDSRP